MSHGVKINGTNYGLSGGKTKTNGTNGEINSRKTLINSTSYDISFSSRYITFDVQRSPNTRKTNFVQANGQWYGQEEESSFTIEKGQDIIFLIINDKMRGNSRVLEIYNTQKMLVYYEGDATKSSEYYTWTVPDNLKEDEGWIMISGYIDGGTPAYSDTWVYIGQPDYE